MIRSITIDNFRSHQHSHLDSILVDLIIEQDALLKAAVEFLIERKK